MDIWFQPGGLISPELVYFKAVLSELPQPGYRRISVFHSAQHLA
jgi:hypothetical protein